MQVQHIYQFRRTIWSEQSQSSLISSRVKEREANHSDIEKNGILSDGTAQDKSDAENRPQWQNVNVVYWREEKQVQVENAGCGASRKV